MKIFIRSTRDGQIIYTAYDGQNETTIITLMSEIGHTDITTISEQTYLDSQTLL